MYLFNKTIRNITTNYIPQETIICNERDPLWVNQNIKKLINYKTHGDKYYLQNENNYSTFQNSQFLQFKLNSLRETSQHNYVLLSKKAIRSRNQSEIVLVYIKYISE